MSDTVSAAPAAETFVWVRGEASDSHDEEAPGVYLVMVDPSAPEPLCVDAALAAFHDKIGIAELADFEIFVTDENGLKLEQPENEIQGSIRHAQFIGTIAREDWPNGGEPVDPTAPTA